MSSGSIRIIQLPEKSSVNTDDYMAVDSSANGTKKVKFTDLLDDNLSAQNKAADAQATGEAINDVSTRTVEAINNVNTRIDNMINTQQNASVTTLWTGTLDTKNQSVTLSQSIANFDFIDVYVGDVDAQFIRRHVASTINIDIQIQNMSDDASAQFLRWWETGLTISGTTATINKCIKCYWDDFSQAPVVSQATDGATIRRIDGVKIGHIENDEIVDARVGVNDITYPTLGDAIRGQVTDLESEINYIEDEIGEENSFAQLQNGTHANPANAVAVHFKSRMPASFGDTVEIFTDRPNATGYHYVYGFYAVNGGGTAVINDSYPSGVKRYPLLNTNVSAFEFDIAETDGTNYNTLRTTSFDGYNVWVKKTAYNVQSVENIRVAMDSFVPALRDGTVPNTGNATAVTTAMVFPINNNRSMLAEYTGELLEGEHLVFYIGGFKASGNGKQPQNARIDGDQNAELTYTAEVGERILDLSAILSTTSFKNAKCLALSVYRHDGTAYKPLRISNVGDVLKISMFNDPKVQKLWDGLQTIYPRETFAYISNGGNFVFKDDEIFDGSGRCAWKTTGKINIKLPNAIFPKSFSVEDIVSALTSDDLYNDGTTTWIYLRQGRGLVYNDATTAIESIDISASTPLADKTYPILMVWSSQAVGGLLYDKFLSDIQTIKINQAISGGASGIATEINNARHIAGDTATPLTLLHFSDTHADTDAINRILTEADNYSNSIDEMICTGDMVANTAEQIASWWNPSVMTCIGNHDSASYDSLTGYDWTALSMADRDAYYIAPFESNWGITHTTGTSYYYKDYATQKIRLIVMDAMLYTDNGAEATAQTSWLANLLSDAITNNLHVLIAIHAPHGGATAKNCSFSRYNQGVMPTNADCNTPQIVIDTVATAIGNGLNFIGYIVGHTHQDNMWDAENDGTQLMYCITCAAVSQRAQWINSDQNRSITEDAYNLVTIDTAHTLVKIVRGGGANIDDHMRTRKAICFNYSTGEMVGEVL